MHVVQRASALPTDNRPISAALGMFDGVHLGHRSLLELAKDHARKAQGLSVAITFDRHPNTVVAPDRTPPLIQTLEHRLALLDTLGIDAAVVIPFTPAFSRLRAEGFLAELVADLGRVTDLCVGHGFTFGHRRSGDVSLLQAEERRLGYRTHPLEPVCLDRVPIRSTRVRELIAAGHYHEASRLLGRPYSIASTVQTGDRVGTSIGFPTANLDTSGLVLPPFGVYTARVIVQGESHPAVFNLGSRPTFSQPKPQPRLEVHILDFHGNLYGQPIEVIFGTFLRPETRFDSLQALQAQIHLDVAQTRTLLVSNNE